MPALLYLSVPDLVVDVERHWEGAPPGQPIIVGGSREGGGHVVAACLLARRAGVRVGVRLRTAAALLPDALFAPGVLDRYAEAASTLDELVRRWCLAVEWVAIDRAVVLASAVRSGSLAAAADAMQSAMREELGLSSAAGIADTETAAAVAAALVAPSGRVHVLPGYDARFLAPLDLCWLPGLSTAARGRLEACGVETIGALAAMPAQLAAETMGIDGAALWHAARADDARRFAGTTIPRSLTRVAPLCAGAASEDVQLAAEDLADQLAQRLTQIGAFTHAVTVRVVGVDQRFRSQTRTLCEGTGLRADLAPIARALASKLWRYGDPPARVSVVASALTADGPQLSLFDGAAGMPRRVSRGMAL